MTFDLDIGASHLRQKRAMPGLIAPQVQRQDPFCSSGQTGAEPAALPAGALLAFPVAGRAGRAG